MSAITITWKNCVGAAPGSGGPEGVGCFVVSVYEGETVNVTANNNASSDATADDFGGSGNLVNQTDTDFFTTPGSGDLTLKAGSNGILAGVTLLPGVSKDILENGRQPSGNFDIGAHRYPFPKLSNGMIQFS